MSIFEQTDQSISRAVALQPGSLFWDQWVKRYIVSSSHTQDVEPFISDDTLTILQPWAYAKLAGKIDLEKYLDGISGLYMAGQILVIGDNGKFESPESPFDLGSATTININDIDCIKNIVPDACYLSLSSTKSLVSCDLTRVRAIHCIGIATHFDNCTFGLSNQIYYDCPIDGVVNFTPSGSPARKFFQHIISHVYSSTRCHLTSDPYQLDYFWFDGASQYSISEIFGITDDINTLTINFRNENVVDINVICIPRAGRFVNVDGDVISRDGFKIGYSIGKNVRQLLNIYFKSAKK